MAPVPVAEPVAQPEPAGYTLVVDNNDPRAVQRAAILSELETVDRELDAIDEELAASAVAGPPSRDDAIAIAGTRIRSLSRTAPEALFEDTPGMLVRIASAYFASREHDLALAKEYGERHPERIEQRRTIDGLRAAFDRQRDVELAEAEAWRDELGKLPRTAPAANVRQANRRALQAMLARFSADAVVPSDAPAEVRVAATRVAEAKLRVELAAPSLGPKHPDMIAMATELAAARDALRAAVSDADARISREIAALDSPRARPAIDPRASAPLPAKPAGFPLIDPARLARRAELATRARDLRREWDAVH
jgi:hypothetical protein